MSTQHPIIVIDEDHDEHRLIADAHLDLDIKSPLVALLTCEQLLPYLHKETVTPKLIICDYCFRTMNSIQLRRQLLTNTAMRIRQIPFVIWSSVAGPIDHEEVLELEIQALIPKPCTYVQLLSTYNTIVARWGKVYDAMHCADAGKSRAPELASFRPIKILSASASMF